MENMRLGARDVASSARCRGGEDQVTIAPISLVKPLRVQLVTGKKGRCMELRLG